MKSVDKNLSGLDLSRFDKLNFNSTFDDGVLFPINLLDAVVKHVCPYCGCKLYEMKNKPFVYCKSKSHSNRFIINKSKLK